MTYRIILTHTLHQPFISTHPFVTPSPRSRFRPSPTLPIHPVSNPHQPFISPHIFPLSRPSLLSGWIFGFCTPVVFNMLVLQQILAKCVLLRAVYELDADVAGNDHIPMHSCHWLYTFIDGTCHVLMYTHTHYLYLDVAGAVCEDTKSEQHTLSYSFSHIV